MATIVTTTPTHSKYADVHADIEEVFATAAWKATKITAIPSNFNVTVGTVEFVKLEILPNSIQQGYADFGVKGQVIIQIYPESGTGTKRMMAIADILDTLLETKTFIRGTQTGSSVLNVIGTDTANPALYRADYTVGFTLY